MRFSFLIPFLVLIAAVQAWSPITHVQMALHAYQPHYIEYYVSGALAPDFAHFMSGTQGWQTHGHNLTEAKMIALTVYKLAETPQEREFAKGWLAHLMADAVAHGCNGLPNNDRFCPGYVYHEMQKWNQSHGTVEQEVDGLVWYMYGAYDGKFVKPVDLIVRVMKELWNLDLPKENVSSALGFVYSAHDANKQYWQIFGLPYLIELGRDQRHTNVFKYDPELGYCAWDSAIEMIREGLEEMKAWILYDKNEDSRISDNELVNAIMDWLNNKLADYELIEVIQKWLQLAT